MFLAFMSFNATFEKQLISTLDKTSPRTLISILLFLNKSSPSIKSIIIIYKGPEILLLPLKTLFSKHFFIFCLSS